MKILRVAKSNPLSAMHIYFICMGCFEAILPGQEYIVDEELYYHNNSTCELEARNNDNNYPEDY